MYNEVRITAGVASIRKSVVCPLQQSIESHNLINEVSTRFCLEIIFTWEAVLLSGKETITKHQEHLRYAILCCQSYTSQSRSSFVPTTQIVPYTVFLYDKRIYPRNVVYYLPCSSTIWFSLLHVLVNCLTSYWVHSYVVVIWGDVMNIVINDFRYQRLKPCCWKNRNGIE